jgi:hypothetical protein
MGFAAEPIIKIRFPAVKTRTRFGPIFPQSSSILNNPAIKWPQPASGARMAGFEIAVRPLFMLLVEFII